jgi:U3 small nucleolar RNA-associated protein 22
MELGNKNKKFKSSENFKPPSAEELYQLKSTETLYNSNLFRLQINELISEIAVADTDLAKYEKTCDELIKNLKNLKSIVDTKFNDLKKFEQKNIVVPLGELSQKMEGVYSFKAPTNVHKIGSHASHTMINKTNLSLDLAVEMPAELFNERDYLNYKYFIKRSLYASHVCLQLLNHKKYSDVKMEYLANHLAKYKPLLALYFKGIYFSICSFWSFDFIFIR